MFNPTDAPFDTLKDDDYLAIPPVHPFTLTSNVKTVHLKPQPAPDPQDLARQMVDAILKNRGPDNGGDGGAVNHQPEALSAALYNAACEVLFNGHTDMNGVRVCVFHLCHGFSRCLIAATRGMVLWDKVVDHGGWLQVLADRTRSK